MKSLLFVFFAAVLAGCTENIKSISGENSPLALIDSFSGNPVVQALYNEDIAFKWHYDIEHYKELKPLNKGCHEYYLSLSVDEKEFLRIALIDEALSLALDSKVGVVEIITGVNGLDSYNDYLSGGAAYFLSPSRNAREYLKEYDVFEGSYLREADFKAIQSKIFQDKDLVVCVKALTLLGALGFDNIAKQTYEKFAEKVSRTSRQQVLDKYSPY